MLIDIFLCSYTDGSGIPKFLTIYWIKPGWEKLLLWNEYPTCFKPIFFV